MPDIDLQSCVGKTFERDGERWKVISASNIANTVWCVLMNHRYSSRLVGKVTSWKNAAWLAGAVEVKGEA